MVIRLIWVFDHMQLPDFRRGGSSDCGMDRTATA
jgi:hypothetical protein